MRTEKIPKSLFYDWLAFGYLTFEIEIIPEFDSIENCESRTDFIRILSPLVSMCVWNLMTIIFPK